MYHKSCLRFNMKFCHDFYFLTRNKQQICYNPRLADKGNNTEPPSWRLQESPA